MKRDPFEKYHKAVRWLMMFVMSSAVAVLLLTKMVAAETREPPLNPLLFKHYVEGMCSPKSDHYSLLHDSYGEDVYDLYIDYDNQVMRAFWYNPVTWTWTITIADDAWMCTEDNGVAAGPLTVNGLPLQKRRPV